MSEPLPTVEPAPPSTPPGEGDSSIRDLTTGSAGTMVLLVLVFICYAWLTKGAYVWQDDVTVVANPTLRDFNGLSQIWTQPGATPQYYPLTYTSFWLEARVFGLKPGVSHVINALLHAGSVLLLWKILRRLAVPGAWMAAAIFAVHPMNVESVAWISQRTNTLSVILALSATYLYLAFARLGTPERAAPAGEGFNVPMPDDPSRLYRLFLALFVLALLAKTTVALLPLMLLAIVWWQRGRIGKPDVMPMLPALGLALVAWLVTAYFEHSPQYVGASGAEWDVSVVGKLLLLGQTTLFYFVKILWPFPIGYSFAEHKPFWPFAISINYFKWTLNAANPLQWLPLAALVGTLGLLWAMRGRIGRGPLATGVVFLLGLLPVSGLSMLYPMRFSWVADHFAYLGQIGLIVGVVAGVTLLLRRREAVANALGSVMLLAMVVMTFWHALSFMDNRSLWRRSVKQSPQSWLVAVNYGEALMSIADEEYNRLASTGDVEKATEKRDDFRRPAELWFREAIRLNRNAYEAHYGLGELANQRGKADEAVAHYREAEAVARSLGSNYLFATLRLAEGKLNAGRVDEAIATFKALEEKEGKTGRNRMLFAQVHTRLGDALRQQQARTSATQPDSDTLLAVMSEYDAAMALAPDYLPPKLRLAGLLLEQERMPDGPDPTAQALQLIQDVMRLDVDNIDAKLLTARAAEKQGRLDLAAAQLNNLTQRYPDFIPGQLQRAVVLQAMGQTEEAKAGLRRMLDKYPDAKPVRALLDQMEGRATTRPAAPTTMQLGG